MRRNSPRATQEAAWLWGQEKSAHLREAGVDRAALQRRGDGSVKALRDARSDAIFTNKSHLKLRACRRRGRAGARRHELRLGQHPGPRNSADPEARDSTDVSTDTIMDLLFHRLGFFRQPLCLVPTLTLKSCRDALGERLTLRTQLRERDARRHPSLIKLILRFWA